MSQNDLGLCGKRTAQNQRDLPYILTAGKQPEQDHTGLISVVYFKPSPLRRVPLVGGGGRLGRTHHSRGADIRYRRLGGARWDPQKRQGTWRGVKEGEDAQEA